MKITFKIYLYLIQYSANMHLQTNNKIVFTYIVGQKESILYGNNIYTFVTTENYHAIFRCSNFLYRVLTYWFLRRDFVLPNITFHVSLNVVTRVWHEMTYLVDMKLHIFEALCLSLISKINLYLIGKMRESLNYIYPCQHRSGKT